MDVIIKRYGALAGLHPSKLHFHTLKHSICVLLWQETHDLNAIQDHVGHRSSSSTLVYLRADAAQKAQTTIAGMSFGGACEEAVCVSVGHAQDCEIVLPSSRWEPNPKLGPEEEAGSILVS